MSIFLGKNGLTATSANHIANIAKEMYESIEAQLQAISFTSKDFTLANGDQTLRVENESTKDDFLSVSDKLTEVANLKSLIAWLREGIKAKEAYNSSLKDMAFITQLIKQGSTEYKLPEAPKELSFEEMLSQQPIEKQAKYYSLEAKCATLGKFVHPDGHLSEARKQYLKFLKNPIVIKRVDGNVEVSKYSSNFNQNEVDEEFFKLQREYRAVQSELNSIKYDIESKIQERYSESLRAYKSALMKIEAERKLAINKWKEEVKSMKICIPHYLQDIYEKVATVANG